jgi:thiamine biosynthesis lipoprotein
MLARLAARVALLAALALIGCAEPVTERLEWNAMGTSAEAEVVTRGRTDADELLAEIRQRTEDAAIELDPRSSDGGLGRLNREAGERFYRVEQIDLLACLRLALDYARESGGAYDPTIGALRELYATRIAAGNPPNAAEIDAARDRVGWEKVSIEPEASAFRYRAPGLTIDLGPVARGCAVDWAARTFAHPGTLAGRIRLDGVFRAWQSPPGSEDWAIPLPDPRAADRSLGTVRVVNRAVAVCGQRELAEGSGQSELRRVPIIDPRNGQPVASDLSAVVTTADSAADAAALCHAVYVAGSLAGTEVFRSMRRAEALFVVRGDAGPPYVVASASLNGRFEPSAELDREVAGDVRYLLPPESF